MTLREIAKKIGVSRRVVTYALRGQKSYAAHLKRLGLEPQASEHLNRANHSSRAPDRERGKLWSERGGAARRT
jgi:hypothetical protein